MSETKVLVLLSGCGVFDGSEIHESVITLLALSKLGATAGKFLCGRFCDLKLNLAICPIFQV